MNTAILKQLVQKNIDDLGANFHPVVEVFANRLVADIIEGSLIAGGIMTDPNALTPEHVADVEGAADRFEKMIEKGSKKCEICKKKFDPTKKNQKKCKSVECKRESSRIRMEKTRAGKKKKGYAGRMYEDKKCVNCGKDYTPNGPKQAYCKSKECVEFLKQKNRDRNTARRQRERVQGK